MRRLAVSLVIAAVAACGAFGTTDEGADGTSLPDAGSSDATATAADATTRDVVVPVADAGACANRADCERLLFVTSKAYAGSSLGGLAGADAKCQALADTAGGKLAGHGWAAWLSDATTAAGARVTHGTRAYRLPNGNLVANDWTQLVSGSLAQSINVQETGAPDPSANVWTGTYADGGAAPATCTGWTGGDAGLNGSTSSANGGWTSSGTTDCAAILQLFCIER